MLLVWQANFTGHMLFMYTARGYFTEYVHRLFIPGEKCKKWLD